MEVATRKPYSMMLALRHSNQVTRKEKLRFRDCEDGDEGVLLVIQIFYICPNVIQ